MNDDDLAQGIIEGLEEAIAWKKGELALEVVNLDPMPAGRIRDIRKRFASSTKVFEKRFGIPAVTMNNWSRVAGSPILRRVFF